MNEIIFSKTLNEVYFHVAKLRTSSMTRSINMSNINSKLILVVNDTF